MQKWSKRNDEVKLFTGKGITLGIAAASFAKDTAESPTLDKIYCEHGECPNY